VSGTRTPRRAATEPRPPPDAEQAFEIAGRFLGTRPRSRWEVEQRLRRSGTSDDVVAATLARLERVGFVDDVAFARWWVEQRDRHAPRGRVALETELRAKRVPAPVIADLRTSDAGDVPMSEDERADAALGMFLVRRGFSPETARSAIRRRGAAG
jgi:regulatory protein